ncbi:unnamed protein product, partial [Meganyctiphanes norvegica]
MKLKLGNITSHSHKHRRYYMPCIAVLGHDASRNHASISGVWIRRAGPKGQPRINGRLKAAKLSLAGPIDERVYMKTRALQAMGNFEGRCPPSCLIFSAVLQQRSHHHRISICNQTSSLGKSLQVDETQFSTCCVIPFLTEIRKIISPKILKIKRIKREAGQPRIYGRPKVAKISASQRIKAASVTHPPLNPGHNQILGSPGNPKIISWPKGSPSCSSNISLSYRSLWVSGQLKSTAEKRAEVRRKSLLILVHHYLEIEGFQDAAKSLAGGARLNTDQFTVCENVDLSNLLQEYEAWYVVKNQRYPRLAKRIVGGETQKRPNPKPHRCEHDDDLGVPSEKDSKKSPFFRRRSVPRNGSSSNGSSLGRAASDPSLSDETIDPRAASRGSNRSRNLDSKKRDDINRGTPATGRRVATVRKAGEEKKDPSKSSSDTDSDRGGGSLGPVRPKGMPRQTLDLKQMISDYTRLEDNIGDIGKGPPRKPGDPPPDATAGGPMPPKAKDGDEEDDLDGQLVRPAMPYFTGEYKDLANIIQREVLIENPNVTWNDILGLGEAKRLMKEAVVYPLKYPQLFVGRFKPWRGILLYGPPGTGKTLLAKAVATECRTTFFNISATSLVSKWRGDSEKLVRVLFEMARHYAPSTIFVDEIDSLMSSRQGEQEHEASRRMKTQILVELDGLGQSSHHVFLLAASNIPWELDPAMLRRLEKRIIVPLPSQEARKAMFEYHLPAEIEDLQEAGHSISAHLDYDKLGQMSEGYSGSDLKVVCREAAMGCLRKVFNVLEDHSVEDSELPDLKLDAINMRDVEVALSRTKPAQNNSHQYKEWDDKFGSA